MRRWVVWALVVGIGVAALLAIALSAARPEQVLDPDDAGPTGGKALVEVLRDHGVEVQVVRSVDALAEARPGPGSTVVMASSAYVGRDSAVLLGQAAAGADRLVLFSPDDTQLSALDLPMTSGEVGARVPVTAGCRSTVARDDDTATLVDVRFIPVRRGTTPANLCFALPNPSDTDQQGRDDFGYGAAMATVPAGDGLPEVVAMGMAGAFTNRDIAAESHAGLAVRALGHSPRLVWYQPGIADLANHSGASSGEAWPVWLGPASAVLATALLLLAFVRGRRMGALVAEPLPVVVRAVETTESRGRIYRRARDRGRVAAILRLATIDRLARRLALPPQDAQAVQVAAAAASGMPLTQVAALLTGPVPTTDVELHTLATALTDLEERVRTS